MSEWIARVALLVRAQDRLAAAQTFAQITGRAEDGAPESFALAVGAPGAEAPSHYAALTRVRRATLELLPELAQRFEGSSWLICQHDEDTPAQAAERLDWTAWLEGQGLALWRDEEGGDDG